MSRPKSALSRINGIIASLDANQQNSIHEFLTAMVGNASVVDDETPAPKKRGRPAKEEKAPAVAAKRGRPAKVVEEDDDNSEMSHAEIMKGTYETLEEIQEAMSAAFSDDSHNLSEEINSKRLLTFIRKFNKNFSEDGLEATKELREIAENLFDVDALLDGVGPRAKAKVLANNIYVCALIYLALANSDLDSLLDEAGYDASEMSDHDKKHYIIAAANGVTFEEGDEETDEDETEEDEDEEEEAPAPKKRGRPAKVKDEDEDEDEFETPKRRRAKA